MKKVLVPLASTRNPQDAAVATEFVRETYARKMIATGLTPIFISSFLPIETALDLYKECSGVLLTGGTDLDPKLYGAELHPNTNVAEPLRDEMELALVRRVLADRKPFLGICRGLQVLNVAAGGTLIQHLPESVSGEYHGVSEGKNYDEMLSSTNGHEVLLAADTRIRLMVGSERVLVNSGHHQAVQVVGQELRISGKSPQGVAEVIEHEDPNFFCFGVQGHPECCDFNKSICACDLDVLFKEFAVAVSKYQ
jgi:putative glutamine amidotransferase